MLASPALAKNNIEKQRYASIILDADTLDIVHARNIDSPRYPASMTKVMTLHLVFDALDRGELSLHEKVKVSRKAARTPPVELGLRTGQTITVSELIKSVAVRRPLKQPMACPTPSKSQRRGIWQSSQIQF